MRTDQKTEATNRTPVHMPVREQYLQACRLFRQRKYKDALSLLDSMTIPSCDHREILYARAQCLAALKRFDESIYVCDKLMRLHNDARAIELKTTLQASFREQQNQDEMCSNDFQNRLEALLLFYKDSSVSSRIEIRNMAREFLNGFENYNTDSYVRIAMIGTTLSVVAGLVAGLITLLTIALSAKDFALVLTVGLCPWIIVLADVLRRLPAQFKVQRLMAKQPSSEELLQFLRTCGSIEAVRLISERREKACYKAFTEYVIAEILKRDSIPAFLEDNIQYIHNLKKRVKDFLDGRPTPDAIATFIQDENDTCATELIAQRSDKICQQGMKRYHDLLQEKKEREENEKREHLLKIYREKGYTELDSEQGIDDFIQKLAAQRSSVTNHSRLASICYDGYLELPIMDLSRHTFAVMCVIRQVQKVNMPLDEFFLIIREIIGTIRKGIDIYAARIDIRELHRFLISLDIDTIIDSQMANLSMMEQISLRNDAAGAKRYYNDERHQCCDFLKEY